jgi:BirA family biotin operon repressor/biotin-[acetyl-CoA-carboxylase] ligase
MNNNISKPMPIITYETIDSTSKIAHKLLQANQAEDGTIIWAKTQTDGHGRYGRNWQSAIGNLSFSFIIKNKLNLNQVTTYPFIAALAIKEALKNYLNKEQLENLKFKWPNDIFIKVKKLVE